MFDSKSITMTLTLVLAVGCVGTIDTQSEITEEPDFLDTDSNSLYDAVDNDRDAVPDYSFAESAVINALIDAGLCFDPALLFVDTDGDGLLDAIDLDCDGVPDVSLVPPNDNTPPDNGGTPPDNGGTPPDNGGVPPQTAAECTAVQAINGDVKRIDCSSDATGTTCVCLRNGTMVDTCSQPGTATCSVPNGCCDFGD